MKLKSIASLFLVFGFLFLVLTFFTTKANAQFQNKNYLNTNPDVPQNLHTYTQSVFIEIASAISCQIAGIDPISTNSKCLGIDEKTGKIGFVEGGGGAIGVMGNFISMTFYIPVSTHNFGSYLASNFGIAKKTYAINEIEGEGGGPPPPASSGIGFKALTPTLNLWKTFRNTTYLLFVVLFVIVGLGIMFRIKIDPRTIMTLQNQIPKIIIALVLVTFSYAIAGFLVDLMYVSIYLIMSLFAEQGINPSGALSSNPFGAIGGLGGMSNIAFGVSKSISGIVAQMFDGTLGKVVGAAIGAVIGRLMPAPNPTVFGFSLGEGTVNLIEMAIGGTVGFFAGNKLVGLVAGIITYIVIIVTIFSALLRLWFQLIKAYIYILITTVFAPFYIAFGLIPGRSGFGNWARSMIANLSVFPATIAMFLLGETFAKGFGKGSTGTVFVPPLVGDFVSPDRFVPIIGLGIILLTPEVVNIIREALKAPELKYTAAIGKSLGGGASVVSSTSGQTIRAGSAYLQGVNPTAKAGMGAVFKRLFNV